MRRIVVGVSGSSGQIYAFRLMQALESDPKVETHLIVSEGARICIAQETDFTADQLESLADYVYKPSDIAARISSGSFMTDGMIVVPCSMKTASAIANSYSDNLLSRAADVAMKERRKLVVVPRETPLHSGHLRNLLQLSEMGAVVLPPVPAFYHHPQTVDDIINHTVGKVLDQFGIEHQLFRRWGS
jgi:flavin prenyltransferase